MKRDYSYINISQDLIKRITYKMKKNIIKKKRIFKNFSKSSPRNKFILLENNIFLNRYESILMSRSNI